MCTMHRHCKKRMNRMAASPISPPRRERARFSSISSPSATVQHPTTACPCAALLRTKPLRSYMAQACSAALRLSSDLPHRVSPNPMQRASTSLLGRGVSFHGRSGILTPSAASTESPFSVMCFWNNSVRVSKCLILPTPLLAPSVGQSVPLAFA